MARIEWSDKIRSVLKRDDNPIVREHMFLKFLDKTDLRPCSTQSDHEARECLMKQSTYNLNHILSSACRMLIPIPS